MVPPINAGSRKKIKIFIEFNSPLMAVGELAIVAEFTETEIASKIPAVLAIKNMARKNITDRYT
tara:strand:+ start:58 stop:249 length:192 start_codon:yes stop_codon:yes gene_type:complete